MHEYLMVIDLLVWHMGKIPNCYQATGEVTN